ncbi:MAG TPA: hypothetical protein PLX06_12340, partial [Fimbriimonadaceae bacterium]|nr:hypothetical protein [Fimbriimonadaceae bacterium]
AVGGANQIIAYIDTAPEQNQLARFVYEMPPSSVAVAWLSTGIGDLDSNTAWAHTFSIYVRAARGGSPLDLVSLIVNGVPTTNAGLKFRHAPVVAGTDLPVVQAINRVINEEGIDHVEIQIQITETGD